MTGPARDLLSHFWAPLCAVGSHGPHGANAQICVSVFGASIVPERPRLLVSLSKTNYTHDLVAASGTLAITLLAAAQVDLLEPLGLHSGREGGKLAGLDLDLTAAGDPSFPGSVGVITAELIEPYDCGDATAFLVAVTGRRARGEAEPLSWQDAKGVVGEDFLRRWWEKSAREQEAARAAMRWKAT
jgi:flavin reductase (DIM6/NTAB) family NADH-FMN oxidoreductase RutF